MIKLELTLREAITLDLLLSRHKNNASNNTIGEIVKKVKKALKQLGEESRERRENL